MRPIDADKIRWKSYPNDYGETNDDYVEKCDIDNMPTVDAVPVVHGRWKPGRFNLETGNYEEQCTRCRNFSKEYGKPYCPNCGAKMDIEDGGATNAAD